MPTKLPQVSVKPEEPAKPSEPVPPEKPKISVKPEEPEKLPVTFPPEKPKPSVKPEEPMGQRYVPQLERFKLSVKPSPETERPSPPKPTTEEKPQLHRNLNLPNPPLSWRCCSAASWRFGLEQLSFCLRYLSASPTVSSFCYRKIAKRLNELIPQGGFSQVFRFSRNLA